MTAGDPSVLLQALDLVGVFVFALTGGLVAVRKRLDLFGVLVLSGAAGLGGGVVRDVLIGDTPPAGISDWRLVADVCAAGLVTFWLHPSVSRGRRLITTFDAVGLGLFAVAGTLKALETGHRPLTAVIVGVITGIGGGVIRDLLADEVPQVLAHGELYALPALAGSALFTTLWWYGVDSPAVAPSVAALITVVRLAAVRFDWRAPIPRDPTL